MLIICRSQAAEIKTLRAELAAKTDRAAEDTRVRVLIDRVRTLEAEATSRQATAPAATPAPTGPTPPNLESTAPATDEERLQLHTFLNSLSPVQRAAWFKQNMRQVFRRFGKPATEQPTRVIVREKGNR